MTVIPVQYVSGATLVKLMEGFASKPGMIRTDPSGKILLVLGTGPERQAAVDTVRSFDVDWLRGQSVGIYPVSNGAPAQMVTELENVMDSGESGMGHNLVKFQALERQNSVLVVASKPQLLRAASLWISRLDKSAVASTGVKVYRVKYGDAKPDGRAAQPIFSQAELLRALSRLPNQIAPNSGATTLSTVERLTGGPRQEAQNGNVPPAGQPGQGAEAAAAISTAGTLGPLGGEAPAVPPAAPAPRRTLHGRRGQQFDSRLRQRGRLPGHRTRSQSARPPKIAGRYRRHDRRSHAQRPIGLWRAVLPRQGSANERFPDVLCQSHRPCRVSTLCWEMRSRRGWSSTRCTQYTDVKILSNPSLVVVDNQPATLEVGDQVPISTGSATVLSANNAVVNTVDYKNTGIILNVQPRVNSNGTVLLDIEQEISAVVNDLTAGSAPTSTTTNLTPTISVRRVKSELSVANGQTVLLAGLISETQNVAHSGIPILDQIPFLGSAVSSKNNSISRTELILFIRPQIIRNGADASVVAEELRSKMRGGQLGSLGLPKLFAPQPPRTLQ